MLQGLGTRFCGLKAVATLNLMLAQLALLLTDRGRVLQLRNKELCIDMSYRLLDQLVAVKVNLICILTVDKIPKSLELLLVEIIIQRIVLNLGLMVSKA